MRALKVIASAAVLFVVLPVFIVGILGLLFSPLQTVARATEPRVVFEVSDLMLSEAVMEQVDRQAEAEGAETFERTEDEGGQLREPGAVDSPEATADEGLLNEAPQSRADDLRLEEVGFNEAVAGYAYASADNAGRYSSDQLRTQGAIDDGGYRYTWYSQRVLPGGGLDIEGRHVSADGYVVDAQERVVLASSDLPYGTEVSIPFGSGTGVVLDTGCASGVLDVYTDF